MRASQLSLLLLLVGPMRSLPAQAASRTALQSASRPAYRSLRFDEHWTSGQRSSHWDDAIKAIPLLGDRPATLTVAGQLRWREEFFRAFNLTSQDDDNAQSRVQLSADLEAGRATGWHGRLFAEARDAQSYGRNLPGGARPSDADRHDIQNLFVDVAFGPSFIRYGRQEIAINRERLFGVPDWSNTRRGSQGTRMQLTRGAVTVELVDARPVVVRQERANLADSTANFRIASVGSAAAAKAAATGLPGTWQLYHVYQTVQNVSSGAATRRNTTGLRGLWQLTPSSPRRYTFEVEGAAQRGRTGRQTLDAWFWIAESSVQWSRVHGAPRLALGVEEASGENPSTTATREVFTTLYPAAHAHGGIADVVGRPNMRELHAIGSWNPLRSVALQGTWYRFDRRSLEDGVYNKQNGVLRAASGSAARHVADEFDFTGTWNASRHWRVITGGAIVRPGAFLRGTPGGARTERWGFVGTAFTF